MKAIACSLFIVALAVVSAAQTQVASNKPPDIEIFKPNWNKSHVNPEFGGGNPLFSAEVGAGLFNERTGGATVTRSVTNRRTPLPETHEYVSSSYNPHLLKSPNPSPVIKGYLYQATIRNNGARTIKTVNWEYTFADSIDQSVVARHRFQTRIRIAPGKERKLKEFAIAPPTKVVNAKALSNNPSQPFTEQAVITRIQYADGSVWERPVQ